MAAREINQWRNIEIANGGAVRENMTCENGVSQL